MAIVPIPSTIMRTASPRFKLPTHIVQIIVTVIVMILAGVRLATLTRTAPRTRTNSIALGMGAKSLIIISYQLCAEHVTRFKRYKSLKANLILNSLEMVFWSAVVFMTFQANRQSCTGVSCGIGWAILSIGISLSMLASYAALISYGEFRNAREKKQTFSSDLPMASNVSP